MSSVLGPSWLGGLPVYRITDIGGVFRGALIGESSRDRTPRPAPPRRAISCREMAPPSIIGPLLILLFIITPASSLDDDLFHCESVVKNWAASSEKSTIEERKPSSLRDLLFFLHVPRTGGRTFFHCFLRKLYSSDQECPRSYDKLRFDPSKSDCRLMVTHDDYSLVSKLSQQRTSVVTILRNPIDRVFSTYEFAVEVAARFLVHPNLTSAIQMSARIRPKARSVSTLDIWPWKYLVPWMREDLFNRREARRRGKLRRDGQSNPYDTEDIVMPLHAFLDDPIAHDIIHNGATFQVAGLTNNSWSDEAHQVRRCVRKHPALGDYVLDVAKKRLDGMLYVGLTEEHRTCAAMFADMVGARVITQTASSGGDKADAVDSLGESYHEGSNSLDNGTDAQSGGEETRVPSPGDLASSDGNMTVGKLMEAYDECIAVLRKSQSGRRTMSLKSISPVKFSKEARLAAPEKDLERIRLLNGLDLQLYEHAQGIFSRQRRQRAAQQNRQQREGKSVGGFVSHLPPGVLWIAAAALVLAVPAISLLVRARRRSLKLKV